MPFPFSLRQIPSLTALFMVWCLMDVASAQQTPVTELQPLPPSKVDMPAVDVLSDNLEAFQLVGRDASKGRIQLVSSGNAEFKTAIRAQTLESIQQPYYLQLSAKTMVPISKGDVLQASFWARTIESPMGEAFVGFTFEQTAPPFQRAMGMENSTGKEWKKFNFPFNAVADAAPGEALLNLRLGYLPQIIEIGGITLRNYGKNASLESLPFTSPSYEGRELDADWRKAANERIEKLRKADLKIVVRDKSGRPVPNAQIRIAQTRHAFAFGSAVSAKTLLSEEPKDREYQNQVKGLFNKVVFENDLKWARWDADRETPREAITWLRDNKIAVRGHVLVWPGWGHLPTDLQSLKGDPKALTARIAQHVTDEATALRGQLSEWDVLNEPFTNHDVMDIAGPQVQTEWFRLARQADPEATLYLNDYSILEGGGRNTEHQKHFEDTIAYLLAQNAPLDGIGIQGHFGWNLTSPTKMLAILDRYAKFGKPIQITEFDVQVSDEKLQADFTRDFLTTMFSHPSVNGVVMWGFWEGMHYAPSAALWRKDWTAKPNGQAWLDLVKKQWWTNADGRTNTQGQTSARGFLGDYHITATLNGKTSEQDVTLGHDGQTVKFQF